MEENISKFQKGYDYVIYLLGIKLRTQGEILEKLRVKGYGLQVAEEVVKRLKENHYLDDQRYAEVYIDNLKKYKNFGFFGIKKKLMEKRLPKEIINSVLEEYLGEDEELKIAKRFVSKDSLSLDSREEKARVMRRLASRGFRGSVISKVVF